MLELIVFCIKCLQWIFRKVYGGWRVWNLCVLPREKSFIRGFCARLFGVLPGYARGIFSSIGKWNPILVGLLVVMSINCVVNLCSCVDFVIGFPVWLWTHLEKTLITLMQPSAAQRVAVTRSRSWPAVAAALALHLIIDWKYSFNEQQLQSGCDSRSRACERQRRAARRRRISVISVFYRVRMETNCIYSAPGWRISIFAGFICRHSGHLSWWVFFPLNVGKMLQFQIHSATLRKSCSDRIAFLNTTENPSRVTR